jgi:hypothetical protein
VEVHGDVARQYLDFAAYAVGESTCFEHWAREVAGDADLLAWLARLPEDKQHPTLVFAAARWHGVPAPGTYDALREALLGDDGRIRRTILARATQTNEVGRLATLVPALAPLAGVGALALVEVGASAGLCLYPDRWDYAWHTPGGTVRAGPGTGPALPCQVAGPAPLPAEVPPVAWRGGIDLHPLDVRDKDAMAWLSTLVWPEHEDRLALLRQAIRVASADPPALVAGDLLEELPAVVAAAAPYGTVVVFHSAVAAYLSEEDRERLHQLMTGLVAAGACHWVSNEGKRVLPRVTATGPAVPEELPTFVLGVDGRAVAWTHGHGRSMTWFGPREPA